jgi:hypothetical protein
LADQCDQKAIPLGQSRLGKQETENSQTLTAPERKKSLEEQVRLGRKKRQTSIRHENAEE